MAKILVTGAAGFIGLHVLKQMAMGHDVVAIDNLSDFSNYDIKLKRLEYACGGALAFGPDGKLNSDKISFFKIDILDEARLTKLFCDERFDMVIHLAAMTGIRQSVEQPDIYEKVNVRGFFNIMECCRRHGIKRLLFASSSSVYGNCQDVPFTESSNTDTPLNLYAATKKMNELIAHSYASLYQIQCTGLRFFTVYGPWNRPDMATFTFIRNIVSGAPVRLYNSGRMQRDFTYVSDIATSIQRLTAKMIEDTIPASIPYRIFNIGGGHPVDLLEYVSTLEALLGKKAMIENYGFQRGEMLNTYADCSALFEFIGFKPQVQFSDGLAETVKWYKEHQNIS